jgi:sensor domain DACNV-containing protein
LAYNRIKNFVDTLGLPNPCGPTEFAEIFVNARDASDSQFRGHPDNDETRKLIEIAFATTTCPEEGRYLRFRLFVYPLATQNDELRTIMRLSEPAEVSVETIRRLAPALPSSEYALRVDSREGHLLCDSVIHISRSGAYGIPGRPDYWHGGTGPTGLMIRGDRPGELRVSEDMIGLRLHAGSVEEVIDYSHVPAVAEWLRETAGSLVGKSAAQAAQASVRFGGQYGVWTLVTAVWARILAQTIDARHGGTFAILRGEMAKHVACKYASHGLDLGRTINDFWLASVAATDADDREQLRLWMASKDRLFATADLVASLASVDGCVVLSPDLVVQGFGGEISVDEDSLAKLGAPLIDAASDTPRENQDARQFGGTRHRSAYRLAKVSPSAIVFVISQDGDLRVFCNNDCKVYAFDRLDAWAMPEDRK